MKITNKASLYLLLVTAAWGCTFPLIKASMATIQPTVFVATRFILATLILLPFVVTKFNKTSRTMLLSGLALGVLNGFIYIMQAIGLQTISSSQSAFIIGTNVIFIPFLARLFRINKFDKVGIFSAIICSIGLFIFTDFAIKIGVGSFWCMLSALSIAISVIVLQVVTQKVELDCYLLTFYQVLFSIPIPLLFAFHLDGYAQLLKINIIISLLFCAVIASVVALVLQAKYQHHVGATKAALIYSLEPIFACLSGLVLINEQISTNMLIGGGIMLFGLVLYQKVIII